MESGINYATISKNTAYYPHEIKPLFPSPYEYELHPDIPYVPNSSSHLDSNNPYEYDVAVRQSQDITKGAVYNNPCAPQPINNPYKLEQVHDPAYRYRIINLDNPQATKTLIDREMQRLHKLYLEKGDAGVQRIELEREFLDKELKNSLSYLDWYRLDKVRRLSFMRRLIENYKIQQAHMLRPGQMRTHCMPGQQPLPFGYSSPYDYDTAVASNIPVYTTQELPQQMEKLHVSFEDALVELQKNYGSDYQSYIQSSITFIKEMENKGLVKAPIDTQYELLQVGLASFFENIKPENPLQDPQAFLRDACNIAAWTALHATAPGWTITAAKASMIADQVYLACAQDYDSMKPRQRAELLGKEMAQAVKGFIVNKTMNTAVSKVARSERITTRAANFFNKFWGNTSLPSIPVEHVEVTTPEGTKFKVQQFEELLHLQENSNNSQNLKTIPIIKVSNMKEFFNHCEFGKVLEKNSIKLNQRYGGKTIYRLENKVNDFIKKGYYYYLDSLHFDHIEIFDCNGKAKFVLNLDGTQNINKTKIALQQARKIDL